MFKRSTRKELNKYRWGDFLEKGGNPYQKKKRISRDCQEAIRDFSLIATVVPYKDQGEIFNEEIIERLIGDLLGIRKSNLPADPVEPELDRRRTKLAAMMIEKSIRYCKYQLRLLMPETPSLSEPILKHLSETISICKDIANKVELEQLTAIAGSEEDYLFSWNNVSEHNIRFNKFVRMPFSSGIASCLDILHIHKNEHDKSIDCDLKSSIVEFEDTYSVHITIDENGTGLAKFISNVIPAEKGPEICTVELIVKENDNNKDVFMKKKDRKRFLS